METWLLLKGRSWSFPVQPRALSGWMAIFQLAEDPLLQSEAMARESSIEAKRSRRSRAKRLTCIVCSRAVNRDWHLGVSLQQRRGARIREEKVWLAERRNGHLSGRGWFMRIARFGYSACN